MAEKALTGTSTDGHLSVYSSEDINVHLTTANTMRCCRMHEPKGESPGNGSYADDFLLEAETQHHCHLAMDTGLLLLHKPEQAVKQLNKSNERRRTELRREQVMQTFLQCGGNNGYDESNQNALIPLVGRLVGRRITYTTPTTGYPSALPRDLHIYPEVRGYTVATSAPD
ncbi:hypothetical protein CBL_07922 [Carabus blaptoides fortunei]